MLKEFKEFASRGNVVDLAVGIIIGSAFGKIVSSLVGDIMLPPIGLAIGGLNFTALKWILKSAEYDAAGKMIAEPVTLNYGNFIQTGIDFIIIAFAVFLVVKIMNSMKKQSEAVQAPPKQELLLAEIRDLLKK
ncbi:large-conductance mechanosensitive channel protein MscL [bacterium]|nr:large-conductance mechanosensitive channel protein MscL [bacterium]